MGVAAEYRIPHSEFLSWDASDRDKAIWWHLQQRNTCSRCGTRPEEWSSERGGHRHAYVATETICRGCQVLEAATDAVQKDKGPRERGLHIALIPREEAAADGK